MSTCEPCRTITDCLQFPFVFYSINGGKTYKSPVLSYNIPCPDGTTKTVVLPAGTFVFTLPFPSDFTGPFPPLVFPCSAGGFIVKNIAIGSTQSDIDALVEDIFEECGLAVAKGQAVCAPSVVSSAQVVFDPHCAPGSTLSFSGTPPSWITIDSVNNLVLGAAGEFSSNSQAAADAAAQAVLDGWANQQIALGNLTCSAAACVAQIATIGGVPGGNQYGLVPTYSAAHQRLLALDGITPSVKAINSATNTVIGSDPFFAIATSGCFAISQAEFYISDVGNSRFRVYTENGAFSTNVVTPGEVVMGIYSPVQDRVYALYFDGGGTGTSHIIGVNPATHTVVTDVDTTVDYSLASQQFNLKEQIAFVVPPNMYFYSLPGITLNGSVNLGPFGFSGGACYASNADKILIGVFNTVTGFAEVWEINPATLAVGFKYAITPTSDGMFSLEYNPVTGLVIGKQTSGLMWVIDPMTQTIVCNVPAGTNENAVVDYQTGKVYTEDDGVSEVLIFD